MEQSCENCAYRCLDENRKPCVICCHNYVDRFVPASCLTCMHKRVCKHKNIEKCNGEFMPMGNWIWDEGDDDDD